MDMGSDILNEELKIARIILLDYHMLNKPCDDFNTSNQCSLW